MLDFLRVALENDQPEPFPEPVLDGLKRLIPCATVSHHAWDEHGTDYDHGLWLSADEPARVREVWNSYVDVRSQDPLPSGSLNGSVPLAQAVTFSDFLTLREFRRLNLYDRICRPLGISYVMKLFLHTSTGGCSFVFDAERKDFSQRDRAVLNALAPHLSRLRQRAATTIPAAINQVPELDSLTRREHDVLRLAASGLTNRQIAEALYIAPGTVRKHLDNIYAKLDVPNRTTAINRAFRRQPI
jgi:DNA-binding CsgD family transcriptional regulator